MLAEEPSHPYLGQFVIALSSTNQQYYIDRVITNLDLYNQYFKLFFPMHPIYRVNYPREGSDVHSLPPFFLDKFLKDRSYCKILMYQYNVWFTDRVEMQMELDGLVGFAFKKQSPILEYPNKKFKNEDNSTKI